LIDRASYYNFFYLQLDAHTSCLFTYNTLIKILYMFRAYLQEVYVVTLLSSLCKSELSQIIVLKFAALLISDN